MRTQQRGRTVPGRVLVDTSAYFAITDPRDGSHTAAATITERLAAERWAPYTTNFVIAETHALLLTRLGRRVALQFLDTMERGSTTLGRVTEADEQQARSILRRYDDKDFSFTDAASFVVMERLGIMHAFTFDRHFEQYGFTVLTPDSVQEGRP